MSELEANQLRYRSIKLIEAFKHREAVVKLDELVSLSQHPADYFLRAQTLIAIGRYRDALADCKYSLTQNSNIALPHVAIAFLLAAAPDASLRNGPAALQHLERAIQLEAPLTWRLHSVLAAAHAECGDFETAVLFATKSLNDAPPEFRDRFNDRIKQYSNGEPYRATVESTLATLVHRESSCAICGSPAFMRWPPNGNERELRCADCCSRETAESAG